MDQEQKDMIQGIQFLPCPAKINLNNGDKRLRIKFTNNKHKGQNDNSSAAIWDMIQVTCNNRDVTSILQQQLPIEEEEDTYNNNKNNNNKVRLWTNTNYPPSMESICVQFDCDDDNIIRNTKRKSLVKTNIQVSCMTQIISNEDELLLSRKKKKKQQQQPNITIIMIDPISRPQFDFIMPRTKTLLEEEYFLYFTNYTTVGNNSGPNQAALYAGYKLLN